MKNLLILGLALSTLGACRQDEDIVDPPIPINTTLDLSSQYYTDVNAQPTGSSGSPEDFQQETWDASTRALFTELDTASLPVATASATDVERVLLFPNPATNIQAMYILGLDTVNVKMVLVNKSRTAVWKRTVLVQGASPSSFVVNDYAGAPLEQDSLFRLYYAFSTLGNPYFHTSHADVTLRR